MMTDEARADLPEEKLEDRRSGCRSSAVVSFVSLGLSLFFFCMIFVILLQWTGIGASYEESEAPVAALGLVMWVVVMGIWATVNAVLTVLSSIVGVVFSIRGARLADGKGLRAALIVSLIVQGLILLSILSIAALLLFLWII